MRFLKAFSEIVLFLAGLIILGFVVRAIDLQRLAEIFPQVSWKIWPVFLFYPFMCAWDVWAWQFCFPASVRAQIPYLRLFRIRLAGEGINNITPILDVGGEPLKVILLFRRLGIHKVNGVASCVIDRTSLFIAEIGFVAIGLIMSLALLPMPRPWKWAFSVSVLLFVVLGGAALYAQKRGLFGSVFAALHRLHFDPDLFSRFHIPFSKVDDVIAHYYRDEKHSFRTSVLLHLAGWVMGGVEMMWLLNCVGIPADLMTGIMLEALLQLVRTASFFIPGNLGTQEAGLAFFVYLHGFDPALGFAVSLLKRLRQIVWTGVGFIIWGIYQTGWRNHAARHHL